MKLAAILLFIIFACVLLGVSLLFGICFDREEEE